MSQSNVTLPIRVEYVETPGHMTHVSRKLEPYTPDKEYRFNRDASSLQGPFDPWELREYFLKWRPEDWQGFIGMTGCFGAFRVSERTFERWQRLLREALIRPAREWEAMVAEFGMSESRDLLSKPLPIRFDWRGEVPMARILTNRTLDAIIATIKVDKLQGAEFRVCSRFDCKNPPFKVEARQKKFCSSDCAHLVAVRNSRSRAADAKIKATNKAPNRTQRGGKSK